MNRIFFWLFAAAFACTAVRQLLVTLPFPEDWNAPLRPLWWELIWLRHFVDVLPADAHGNIPSPMDDLTAATFEAARKAVMDVAIKLVGGMTLMLGVMRVVEAGGGMKIIAGLIRPLMVRLFPDVPPTHPAMGAMIMNLAANALGLGNAATPFGIRAMQELDKINPHRGTATNAMARFLAIKGITLLATGVVVLRRETGSTDPAGIIGTTLFATLCSTLTAGIVCLILERFNPEPPGNDPVETMRTEEIDAPPYPWWVSALALGSVVAFVPFSIVWGGTIAGWLMPAIIVGFLAFGYFRGVPVYEQFIEGAKDGFAVAVRIMPYLVGIMVMVAMLTSSGAMDAFTGLVGPFTTRIGMPAQAIPMALVRPLSGSGATAVLSAILADKSLGPDSYTGYLASTIAGAEETTFYVLPLYYGAVQVKAMRHSILVGLSGDIGGTLASIIAVTGYLYYKTGVFPW